MHDIPPMPHVPATDADRQELQRWKDNWRRFRDAAVAATARLLDEHDTAPPIAEGFHELAELLSDDDRSWKLCVQARGSDELNYRYDSDGVRQRRSICRNDEDTWWFADLQPECAHESTAAAHQKVARRLIEDLFYWGDLSHVYLHISLSKESFIPPEI